MRKRANTNLCAPQAMNGIRIDDEHRNRRRAVALGSAVPTAFAILLLVASSLVAAATAVSSPQVARDAVPDGSVILFHEWRKETCDQMPAILAELRRQGCVFLTFSDLAAHVRSTTPPKKSP